MEVRNGMWKKILAWNGIWNGKFLVWYRNGIGENCQNGIWKNRLPFYSIPCQPVRWTIPMILNRVGVENPKLEAKDTKKSEAKAKDSLCEDRLLEAKAGTRTQGKCSQKKDFLNFFSGVLQKKTRFSNFFFRRSPKKKIFKKVFRRSTKF